MGEKSSLVLTRELTGKSFNITVDNNAMAAFRAKELETGLGISGLAADIERLQIGWVKVLDLEEYGEDDAIGLDMHACEDIPENWETINALIEHHLRNALEWFVHKEGVER